MVDEVVMNLTMPFLHNNNIFLTKEHVLWHNFGSWCEGTTTKGLNSDIDKLLYLTDLPAVEEIPDIFENGYLIINDGTTRPGYVKLQVVYNGIPNFNSATPDTDTDHFGRVCLSSSFISYLNMFDKRGLTVERTGPAINLMPRSRAPYLDGVLAYRCYRVPSFTRGWIHKLRKYDWPSKQLLDKMSTYGCFLVGKGHPASQAQHLEWRISFSFQERELMFSLNSTQHKCYILLKMIKQELVTKMNVKSISSYHLKTSLFYTIENNPTHIWIPENIVYCTELCLKQLLDWLSKENCPNFFVPEENMLDRLSRDVMKITAKFIRDMLDSDGQYLMLLTCDKFGELLQESLSGKVLPHLSRDAIDFDLISRLDVLIFIIHMTNRIVLLNNRDCAQETLSALQSLLEQLRKAEVRLASENVFREIKQGVSLVLSNFHIQISKTIAAIILTATDTDKKRELMQEFKKHIEQANNVDIISQRLIKASLLFKQNKFEECERILNDCETSLNYSILPKWSYTNTILDYEFENVLTKVCPASISLLELRTYVTPCLMFLPSQADLVPPPLQYEMYRSVGADTDTAHPDLHYWFQTITIDPKVYLFFLQYLVYLKLKKPDLSIGTILKLFLFLRESSKIIDKRLYIGHMETGLNLLGWIWKHESYKELATKCFYRSWKMRPDHNAAKWHMLVMMYEQYIQRSKT